MGQSIVSGTEAVEATKERKMVIGRFGLVQALNETLPLGRLGRHARVQQTLFKAFNCLDNRMSAWK